VVAGQDGPGPGELPGEFFTPVVVSAMVCR
jgi:hypothetical protein